MAILKCKMCGGDIEISADKTFGTCESCGSTMTFPKLDDEQRADAFNRGNHFRRIGEFDKALSVYEHIVEEEPANSEAHWCCALCRFGIEYVEDPVTFEYVPTCHRASFDIFTEDVDYLAAVENADGITKKQYQKDGAKIAEVQRGILKTSQNEEPFDVFICYKESDESGNRTVDSTLAQDIYYQLTDAGLRVFFARITLEDKVGSEYEPYIFAALNSAKVMVAVGTKPEHFNAVWVKNEWSRFLSIVKHDRSKVILPCYKDMDPYDLPEQLSVLQSYDMSKIGFIQDLIRGIKKVAFSEKKTETVKETVAANGNTNIEPLLKRAFMFLEDGNFAEADEYCEKVLDQNPENARAYLGKLLAELRVKKQENLADCDKPFDSSNNYQKALRFGDEKLKNTLKTYIEQINDRNEQARLESIYNSAKEKMENATLEIDYSRAAREFESIIDYKDAKALAEECHKQEEILIQKQIEIDEANRLEAERKAEEKRIAAEKAAKKRKKAFAIGMPIVAVCIAFVIILNTVIIPSHKYKNAISFIKAEKYDDAYKILEELGKNDEILKNKYTRANAFLASNDYFNALPLLSELNGYKDSTELTFKPLKNIISVSDNHTVVLKSNGKVKAFGIMSSGKCKVSKWENIIAISANNTHTVGLKKDGTVIAAVDKSKNFGQGNVESWTNICAISAGYNYTIGLKYDGTVVACGQNNCGQCDVQSWSDIVAVLAGNWHTVGLKKDGTVVACGVNDYGQCDVQSWSDIVAVDCCNLRGYPMTVGLKKDGTVVACGVNDYGQCDLSSWQNIVKVASTGSCTYGLTKDGCVIAKGYKNIIWNDIQSWDYTIEYYENDIIAKNVKDILCTTGGVIFVKTNGTVVACGDNDDGQCDVGNWSDIVAVSAGDDYIVGLKKDGTVVACGDNDNGQCDVENMKLW